MENLWNCWLVCQQNWIDAKQPLRCFNVIEDDAKSPEWIVSIVSASYEWVRQTCAEYTPQSRIKTHMLADHIVTNCLTSALCYQGKTLYIFCTKFQNSKFSPASFSADNIKQQTQCFLYVNLTLLWLPQWISGDLVETDWSVEQLTVSQWMRWAAGGREDWLSFDNVQLFCKIGPVNRPVSYCAQFLCWGGESPLETQQLIFDEWLPKVAGVNSQNCNIYPHVSVLVSVWTFL